MGRPSDYDEVLADAICNMIAEGQSLRSICEGERMPERSTIFCWLAKHPDFQTKYTRAREAQAEYMDEKILETADNCTPETAKADAVRIGAYQWRAAKLAPKKYGNKVEHEVNGDMSVTIRIGGDDPSQ